MQKKKRTLNGNGVITVPSFIPVDQNDSFALKISGKLHQTMFRIWH